MAGGVDDLGAELGGERVWVGQGERLLELGVAEMSFRGQAVGWVAGSRFLTPAEKQTILTLYHTKINGQWPTIKAVADQAGRSVDSVKRVAEKAGVYRPEKTPITTVERKLIIDLYLTKNGTRWMSTIEIGKVVGRHPKTVWAVVVDAGINRDLTESQRDQVTDEQRRVILHLYRTTRLGQPKIAQQVGLSRHTVCQVLKEAGELDGAIRDVRSRVWRHEAVCIIGLYQQGRSHREVAELTDRTVTVVRNLVHGAGLGRTRAESLRLAAWRKEALAKLATIDIRPLARRWAAGVEPEALAKEHAVPADLMWEALADALSWMTPAEVETPVMCFDVCTYGCTHQCALSLPIAPPPPSPKQSIRPGIPSVRLGVSIPEPGPRSRWGS